jgi:hypothetical protein
MIRFSFLEPNGNFLFSLRGSSSSKFNEASGSASAVLTESGMSFGGDELAITWSGEPAVKNVPGDVFGITDLNRMAGVEQFTADDFEVLQPKGSCLNVCMHGYKLYFFYLFFLFPSFVTSGRSF